MAIATKKKISKKLAPQPAIKAKPAGSKVKAVKTTAATPTTKPAAGSASKPAAKTKASAKSPVTASAPPSTTAKLATKAKQSEPERSSPAMAEVDKDVLEFIAAIDDFKRVNGRPFPSWSEVLLVVRQLGYKRK